MTDGPKIVVLDIETQRAVVETFSLFPKYIHIDRVLTPSRILCFSAVWRGEERAHFHAAWDDNDSDAYDRMIHAAWKLLDDADIVATYNGDRFDLQWFNAEFQRLGLGPPSPYRSLDLFKINKKHFSAGLMSRKLDWSARIFLGDRKIPHEGADLWHQIRYGNRDQRRAACRDMKEYCIKDSRLTLDLLEIHLPWCSINFAIYGNPGERACSKCGSTNVQKRGFAYTQAGVFQQFYCKDRGCWSKSPHRISTTELRPA